MSREEEKKQLIEELGIHLENQHEIPPLAARLYAMLVVTDRDGLSFDECQMSRCASKSSISAALNLLLKLDLIDYFTKPGERKRYFRTTAADAFYINKLEEKLKRIEQENRIITKIRKYNKTYNPEKYQSNLKRAEVYHTFIKKSEELLSNTLKTLKEIDNYN
ncbi:GbsR/MarR family transcriptional regulator [Flavobacterium sp. ASW18X]|uniref:GbsR/MarR family transcriptional regulator n=2 Tax=Flavobacteriaceae TaxID=49546 RepID=UPI0010AE4F9D|nr:transcriptional regulator [Flavobacterium sp. ASW18X]TKD65238.1 transcriptional regulator [Flavobacterium sp. ASW18X]